MKILSLWRLPHQPTPTPTPTHPMGGPPNLLEHDKTLTNQDISILFENLKFVNHPTPDPHPPTSTPTYPTHPQRGTPKSIEM